MVAKMLSTGKSSSEPELAGCCGSAGLNVVACLGCDLGCDDVPPKLVS